MMRPVPPRRAGGIAPCPAYMPSPGDPSSPHADDNRRARHPPRTLVDDVSRPPGFEPGDGHRERLQSGNVGAVDRNDRVVACRPASKAGPSVTTSLIVVVATVSRCRRRSREATRTRAGRSRTDRQRALPDAWETTARDRCASALVEQRLRVIDLACLSELEPVARRCGTSSGPLLGRDNGTPPVEYDERKLGRLTSRSQPSATCATSALPCRYT